MVRTGAHSKVFAIILVRIRLDVGHAVLGDLRSRGEKPHRVGVLVAAIIPLPHLRPVVAALGMNADLDPLIGRRRKDAQAVAWEWRLEIWHRIDAPDGVGVVGYGI